jgi:2-methylisocitrate lyase-like PEP mutase family enzyme
MQQAERAREFRRLHGGGDGILLLANCWDAGSARVIASCGARALATTSAGLAWARGYADGNAIPPQALESAVREIARVSALPLSVDVEAGLSDDPAAVAENVVRVAGAGAVGINLEDGAGSPELASRKIEAAKNAAARRGFALFVNARTDVYLKGLVPADRALDETLARGERYAKAGADGFFAPGLADTSAMRAISQAIALPLNVMLVPKLAGLEALAAAGVRRLSAGSAIAQAALGLVQRDAQAFLVGRLEEVGAGALPYGELNRLFG